ncbi:hypothetical protein ACH5RR_032950 [Cinchona calisaya]|uniref:Uncharacterized protein n=1 Tax=Cinchona calisaya TaxID=153742 RepID=A0ABD2YJK9_9GENT
MAENVEDKAMATEASIACKRNIKSLKQCPEAKSRTALQQHISDFDVNKDGIIYPWEMYAGLRAIGWSIIASSILTAVFNLTFSYASLPGWIPSPLFPVYIKNIHRNKHGSDVENYDKEGRFIPENFEKLLSSLYPLKSPKKLRVAELWKMTEDIIWWIIEKAEWTALYFLAKEEDSSLSIEAGCFDETLYEYLARKHAQTKLKV